jgi:hypothetical protein
MARIFFLLFLFYLFSWILLKRTRNFIASVKVIINFCQCIFLIKHMIYQCAERLIILVFIARSQQINIFRYKACCRVKLSVLSANNFLSNEEKKKNLSNCFDPKKEEFPETAKDLNSQKI